MSDMTNQETEKPEKKVSRREFLKYGAVAAAVAGTTAPYFRNSLRETFFSGFSVSWVVISDIDPFPRGEASTPVVQLLTVSMECSKRLETELTISSRDCPHRVHKFVTRISARHSVKNLC